MKFLFLIIFLLFSCKKNLSVSESKGGKMVVEKNDTIEVEYTGKFENGEVFDTSKGRGPLKFKVGSGTLIPGFENACVGMKLGEEKTVLIKPEDAYGERNESFVRKFPISMLPPDFKVEKGMYITLQSPDGRKIPAKVVNVDKESITLDMNHPLAGKNLIFDIKVVKIEKDKN